MNTVDWTAAFQLAVALVSALGGWFAKEMFSRLKDMDRDMKAMAAAFTDLRVEVAKNYVTKDDFKDALDNIFAALRRIEDQLKEKADKP